LSASATVSAKHLLKLTLWLRQLLHKTATKQLIQRDIAAQ
jgi:hypothetical protein